MINTVKCPKCGEPVEITEALKQQVSRELLASEKRKHEEELERIRKETVDETYKKLQKQFEGDLKRTREEALENEQRNKKLLEQVTEITRDLRLAKREKEEAKLAMEKKLAIEE